MRLRYIFNSLGLCLRYLSLCSLFPLVFGILYKEYNCILPFAIMGISSLLLSYILSPNRIKEDYLNDLKKIEAFFVVVLVWVSFSLLSAIPYLFCGLTPINAIFEAVSGTTTTGATILTHFDYPKTLFFWRALTQWLGGMGIIVLFIAVLPQFAVAGRQMFFAEAPSPIEDKITPRIRFTASALWKIYVILTFVEIICLKYAGLSFYDSICNSLTTISAGGFSPHSQSIMGYHSNLVIWIISFFMFLSGINFALQYKAFFKGKILSVFDNEEFRSFLILVLIFSLSLGLFLFRNDNFTAESSLMHSIFQVLSAVTTNGFASSDFGTWTISSKMIIFVALLIGGCAGSASGGLKIVRALLIFKYLKNEIKKIAHPNGIFPIKLGKTTISEDVMKQITIFFIFYFMIFLISAIATTMIENNLATGLSGSIATISNFGPGFNMIGPMNNYNDLSPLTKIIYMFNMLIGRLELIPFLAMFHFDFWNLKK